MKDLPVLPLVGDKITVPEKYSKLNHYTVRMPWVTIIHIGRSQMTHCRSKEHGDKPYVPEGTIEFKQRGLAPERYRVVPDIIVRGEQKTIEVEAQ